MKKKLYMAVTNDEYELPVAVSDRLCEVARMTGKRRCNVSKMLARKDDETYNPTGLYRYIVVEVDEEE